MNSNEHKTRLTPFQYEALKVFQNMTRAQQEAFIEAHRQEGTAPEKTEDKET